MKIRIKGDSIRYRLTRPEVERFGKEGIIKEETHFGDRTLSYVLQQTDADAITAQFVNDTITLLMPATMAAEWINTDRVGFDSQASALALYIEKDFKCLDNVAEDQSDNYPNPLAMHSHEQD